jgi:hypothetical protein
MHLLQMVKTMKNSVFLFLFFLLFPPCSIACIADPADEIVSIENGLVKLGFDRHTGTLLVFRDLMNEQDYLDTCHSPCSPWTIDLISTEGIETIDMVSVASVFHFEKENPHTIILTWNLFQALPDSEKIKITAVVTLDENKPLSSWKISIDGMEGKEIDRITFPRIPGIKDMGEEHLAVPSWMGQIIKNPRGHLSKIRNGEKKYHWDYPGPLSMQCLALYHPDQCGIYASCNDTMGFVKSFSFTLDNSCNLTYEMHHYPSLDSTSSNYSPAYEALVGSFKGDWITAADLYRQWSSRQKWCRESRLKRGFAPAWLQETALWVWNRGKSPGVLEPALDLSQALGLPVSVFWHWWHGCAYDIGFPEYLPPREGRESFIQAVTSAQEKGVRSIVYMNHFQWGNSTASWKKENAAYHAVKDRNGKMYTHVFNIFTGKSLTNMCIATDFWQHKYAALCDSAVNAYQVNGVYMDQACISRMCYDVNHGHPLGGGNYWSESFTDFAGLIRSRISQGHHPILTGEGALELRIPDLDAFLTLQVSKERYMGLEDWETIPFFQAVYHPYAITYGNYSSLTIPPYDELWPEEFAPEEPLRLLDKDYQKQFMMEQARSFVWGMQPTIANYRNTLVSEREEETSYLFKLVKVRNLGLKYLLNGEFLRSPAMEIPEARLKLSKLSIYKGREENSVSTFYKCFPLIYSGTWRSDDNHIGIALASISDDPYRVDCSFPCSDYDLPPSGKIYQICATGKTWLSDYLDGMVTLDFTLDAKDLCIVEIVPGI